MLLLSELKSPHIVCYWKFLDNWSRKIGDGRRVKLTRQKIV